MIDDVVKNPNVSFDEKFTHVMRSATVHNFTKEVIRKGVQLDAVDAYYDLMLAAEVLRARMESALSL